MMAISGNGRATPDGIVKLDPLTKKKAIRAITFIITIPAKDVSLRCYSRFTDPVPCSAHRLFRIWGLPDNFGTDDGKFPGRSLFRMYGDVKKAVQRTFQNFA